MRATRGRGRRWRAGAIAVSALCAVLLSGCSATPGPPAAVTSAAPGDLLLKIGTILPQSGTLVALAPPQVAGVDLAVQEINNAAAGLFVSVDHEDSGDAGDDVGVASARKLIGSGTAAVIGAASNAVSAAILGPLSAARVVQVSPSTTSADFTTAADRGYFWRTSASNVVQGRALANRIVHDGGHRVSVLYMSGDYGLLLDSAITSGLHDQGATVVSEQVFKPGAKDFHTLVQKALAPHPDALVVVSFGEITEIATELAATGFDFSTLYGVDGNFGIIDKHEHGFDINGAQFTYPGVMPSDKLKTALQALVKAQGAEPLTIFGYAAESYDATVLVALAALQGGAADGTTIRDNLRAVSEGGTRCVSFSACAALIKDGADVDFDGKSGPITFNTNGDIAEGYVSIYKYGPGNTTEWVANAAGDLG